MNNIYILFFILYSPQKNTFKRQLRLRDPNSSWRIEKDYKKQIAAKRDCKVLGTSVLSVIVKFKRTWSFARVLVFLLATSRWLIFSPYSDQSTKMFYLLPAACTENSSTLERLAKIVLTDFFFLTLCGFVTAWNIFWTDTQINNMSFVLYRILLLWVLLSTLQHSIMYLNPSLLTICSFMELNTSQKFSYISYEFEAIKCLALFQIFVLYIYSETLIQAEHVWPWSVCLYLS